MFSWILGDFIKEYNFFHFHIFQVLDILDIIF